MSWEGHVARIRKSTNAYIALVGIMKERDH
jgi:hypothetical protein